MKSDHYQIFTILIDLIRIYKIFIFTIAIIQVVFSNIDVSIETSIYQVSEYPQEIQYYKYR